jgi:hypothetical protein
MVSIYPIEKKFKAIYIPERPDISWSLQKSANGSSTNNNQDG